MSSRDKLYFISDAHLGAGADTLERERLLCRLLDGMSQDAAMIVFLGDIFDFWFTYRYVVPRGSVRILGKMAELADQGIKLHFFIGNHDMWLFDYLPQQMDVEMHDEPEIIEFDDKRFLVGHGDGLGHLDRRYDFIRWVFRNKVNQWLFSLLPPALTFGVAHRWSHSSRKGHVKKNPKIFEYQGDEREGIVVYCRERLNQEHIDYCVFGHRHTPISRVICGTSNPGSKALYINVGDWLLHRNYVSYQSSQIQLHEME